MTVYLDASVLVSLLVDDSNTAVARVIAVIPQDFGVGRRFVRQGDSGLRGSDALHLAIAARERLEIATFDLVLARAAAEVGVAVHQL